ncbi:MAG: lycopene cyclase domain-containing protein [Cyclobacteriaceae bacterium]|nr:lycopene cyclase domain-containing protein [Cytophagales bacterium]HNP77595.1 lycopene cyclase domain-containing protein [Cyclobacteriaceae bacterium]
MEKYYYLSLDFLSIIFPLMFSFYPKADFSKKWRFLGPAIAIPAVVFIIWDSWFTSMGVWGFNDRYLTGLRLGNLPIEEVLFFVCIPYACVFTYEAVNYLLKTPLSRATTAISGLMVLALAITGGVYIDHWYTSVTFIGLVSYLIILYNFRHTAFLSRFYFTFLFILIPFFIVNGILTGTGLPEPIVWYNDTENLGLRMLTIPVEDTFYGMLLILMNVSIFEFLQQRSNSRS